MTREELAAIEARHARATKGPWLKGFWGGRCHKPHAVHEGPNEMRMRSDGTRRRPADPCVYDPEFYPSGTYIAAPDGVMVAMEGTDGMTMNDADQEFIANSWADVARLIARVRELEDAAEDAAMEWREHECRSDDE